MFSRKAAVPDKSARLDAEPSLPGLLPVSQATRIANLFLIAYLVASVLWIVLSDHLVGAIQRFAPLPEWYSTAKGLGYVLVCGLVLRRATRVYLTGIERAHAVHIGGKLELVRRLALAAEYRDDQTGGHNHRIGRSAQILARELGMPAEFCDVMLHAAPLHDVGKIGIPDAILFKRGPLDPDERLVVERHAQLGAELLANGQHPLIRAAHAIALTHHERWDGTGYPCGLEGENIPIEGRIVAVCDVFDALVSSRPYKAGWYYLDAVAEIVRLSGTHFDPVVVAAFVRCLPEIFESLGEEGKTAFEMPLPSAA